MKAGIFDFEYSVCHFIFHRMLIEDIWMKNTHYCDHGDRGGRLYSSRQNFKLNMLNT